MNRNVVKSNTISINIIWVSIYNAGRKEGHKSPNVKFTSFHLGILQHTNRIHRDKTLLEFIPSIKQNWKIRKKDLDENLYILLFYFVFFLKSNKYFK